MHASYSKLPKKLKSGIVILVGQAVFASGLTRPDAYIYLELAMITAVEMWIDDGATQWAKFSISAVT